MDILLEPQAFKRLTRIWNRLLLIEGLLHFLLISKIKFPLENQGRLDYRLILRMHININKFILERFLGKLNHFKGMMNWCLLYLSKLIMQITNNLLFKLTKKIHFTEVDLTLFNRNYKREWQIHLFTHLIILKNKK